jgi:predicted metal-dependent phosphoesterase TrpH
MKDLLTSTLEYVLQEGANGSFDWPGAPSAAIDLHCHSTFSDERLHYLPGMIWHPLAEPEQVYDLAKARGMTHVTITDHDTIDGCKALIDRRGELPDFVFGEEVSVRFPEDGTTIHVNVYDIDEAQHREVQRIRDNIYDLVDYLRKINKLYVLNHMTWTQQQRVLKSWQIEAMLELFEAFEGLNGARSYMHNAFVWQATDGYDKVLVGGSDSHTFRVGTTYTRTQGETRAELIDSIKNRRAFPCGAFGTPERLREDVWLTIQKNVEWRLSDATGRWQRFKFQAVKAVGRALHPLVCVGYHKHQDLLIRAFVRALPAPAVT